MKDKTFSANFAEKINMRAKNNEALGIQDNILKIKTKDIDNWEFRDRSEFELGDLESLSQSIVSKGQIQPIIITPRSKKFLSSNDSYVKYIVIVGYRRWLACKAANIDVDAIINRDISIDNALLMLDAENEDREDISAYSRGIYLSKVLERTGMKQKELSEKRNIPTSTMSDYLSFSKIPKEFWGSIKHPENIKARSASEILKYFRKGEPYISYIHNIQEDISNGINHNKIKQLIESQEKSITNVSQINKDRNKVVSHNDNYSFRVKNNKMIISVKEDLTDELMYKINDLLLEAF